MTVEVTVRKPLPTSIEIQPSSITIAPGEIQRLIAVVLPEGADDHVIWSGMDIHVNEANGGFIEGVIPGETIITATTVNGLTATCKVTVFQAVEGLEIDLEAMGIGADGLEMQVGETKAIEVKFKPEIVSDRSLAFESSDEAVATVDAEGKITALAPGVALITINGADGAKTTLKVTVTQPAEGIEIDFEAMGIGADGLTLQVGETKALAVKFSPENTIDKSLSFASSDEAVATVDAEGVVTAIAPGVATITITAANGVKATLKVTVTQPAEGLEIDFEAMGIGADGLTLQVGETKAIAVKFSPENTTASSLSFASSDEAIATVDAEGVVTAIVPGVATITITAANGVQATLKVTVEQPAQAVEIDFEAMGIGADGLTLKVGETKALAVKFSPENTTDKSLTFESSDELIATVDANGTVTAMAPGNAIITITAASGVSASIAVIVTQPASYQPVEVARSEEEVILLEGTTTRLWVDATGGNPDGFAYEWSLDGAVVGTASDLQVTGRCSAGAVDESTYAVRVTNTAGGETIFDRTYLFTVVTYPTPASEIDAEVSVTRIREGNILKIKAGEPEGGYDNWAYSWSLNGGEISADSEFETTATMSTTGIEQATEEFTYELTATNYGPDGSEWGRSHGETATVKVYRRPQTPAELLRKGDGTSHTLIVMAGLSNSEIERLGYGFVYGYTDAYGVDHQLASTPLRYCQIDYAIFNDPTARKWAYAQWTYADGSLITSGKRYLDGTTDEEFDASIFGNATEPAGADGKEPTFIIRRSAGSVLVSAHAPSTTRIEIFDLNGSKVLSRRIEGGISGNCRIDATDIVPGLYIMNVENETDREIKKIVIKDF